MADEQSTNHHGGTERRGYPSAEGPRPARQFLYDHAKWLREKADEYEALFQWLDRVQPAHPMPEAAQNALWRLIVSGLSAMKG